MHHVQSPNHGPRKGGVTAPDLIVLHYTAMVGGCWPAIKRLCDPKAEVSCHYIIDEDGSLVQLVADDRRAWHAGVGQWGESTDVNSRSLGIELSNDGASPFPEAQMTTLESLLRALMARHGIDAKGVIGHSDCAPGRKIDPGGRFDWARLALQGLAIQPDRTAQDDAPLSDQGFAAHLATYGMTADVEHQTRLDSFRLRFNPGGAGPLTQAEANMAADLAARFPARPLVTA